MGNALRSNQCVYGDDHDHVEFEICENGNQRIENYAQSLFQVCLIEITSCAPRDRITVQYVSATIQFWRPCIKNVFQLLYAISASVRNSSLSIFGRGRWLFETASGCRVH